MHNLNDFGLLLLVTVLFTVVYAVGLSEGKRRAKKEQVSVPSGEAETAHDFGAVYWEEAYKSTSKDSISTTYTLTLDSTDLSISVKGGKVIITKHKWEYTG